MVESSSLRHLPSVTLSANFIARTNLVSISCRDPTRDEDYRKILLGEKSSLDMKYNLTGFRTSLVRLSYKAYTYNNT
jgi:hypothetical protein